MIFEEELRTLLNMSPRAMLKSGIGLLSVVSSAIMIYKILSLMMMCESPFVVVVSGSMEPGYYRGDLVVLSTPNRKPTVGDIPVFTIADRGIPIVHRIHRVHEHVNGSMFVLTKGDNNPGDDRILYNPGQNFVAPEDIIGRANSYVPYIGWMTVWLMENQIARYTTLGLVGFSVFTSHEEFV